VSEPKASSGIAGVPELGETILTQEQIADLIVDLGKRITEDYRGKSVVLVGVLKGALMVMADLSRALDIPAQVEFMSVSSYGASTSSSGVVRILKDLDRDIADRDVIVVEDVVDSGRTLGWLLRNLRARRPESLEVCALLRKPEGKRSGIAVKYVGVDLDDDFVVGYGLDIAEAYRNLPYLAKLKQ
jgi:hypoxanthine phosphoribosyltransferase